jgi:antitoxin ParD1/3/4
MLDLKRELGQQEIERLREVWDAGVASGSAGELDMKKLRRDAQAGLKAAASAVSPNAPRHTRA